jgi:DNA protecting protein DprA
MSGVRLSDDQRLAWLRLIRSENVGPRTFQALINRYGGAAAALKALPDLARQTGRALKIVTQAEAEREMAEAARLGIRFIATGEADYPKTLQAIDSAPPLIALRGDAAVLARPMIAIVGSRNASAAGLAFAERLAGALGEAGYTVVSGLALGIDTRAHRGSVKTGTVAVLAGGHSRVYPADNEPLLERMVEEGGAALSEMPIEWEPRGRDFPRRNRIVSGLAELEELWRGSDRAPEARWPPHGLEPPDRGESDDTPADATTVVIRLLGPAPVSPDELARQSGYSIRAVQSILLELEIAGRLIRHPGHGVSRAT